MKRRDYPPTESDIPMHGWRPYTDIHRERVRAHLKHKDKPGGSMEMHEFDDRDWLPVVAEEFGEVAKVINDHRHGLMDDAERTKQLRAELIQVGAMICAWVDAIDLTYCGDVRAPQDGDDGLFDQECSNPAYHTGEHLSWSGRSQW